MKRYLKGSTTKPIRKICIWIPEHLGDYISARPAIYTLKKNYPNARITGIVGSWNKSIVESDKMFDRIEFFDSPISKRTYNGLRVLVNLLISFPKLLGFAKKINKEEYDIFAILSTRKIHNLTSGFFSASCKIMGTKFANLKEGQDKRLLKCLDGQVRQIFEEAPYKIAEKDRRKAGRLLRRIKGFKIIVHPISPLKFKNWPLENWVELTKLSDKKNKFIFIGTEKESDIIQKTIMNYAHKANVYNFAGKTSLLEMTALIDRADLFLGVDSGPMHLAGLTKTPIIALFGATDEKIWGPKDNGRNIIIKRDDINEISVVEVLKQLRRRTK